jgi:branched-chain amino acid transport system substrate-binding protein
MRAVQGNDAPTSEFDVLNVVQEVDRETSTYDASIFGGELGPAEPAPMCA